MIVTPLIVSLREGIEIALILAIMLSYLRQTNQNDLKRYVFGGVALSIVASVTTAITFHTVKTVLIVGLVKIFEDAKTVFSAQT